MKKVKKFFPFTLKKITLRRTHHSKRVIFARGVNINGAEFGCGVNAGTGTGGTYSNTNTGTYGTNYIYPSNADFAYLAGRGIRFIRLPVRWERLQPTLETALDTTELGRLQTCIDNAYSNGIKTSVALVAYGAYWSNDGGGVGVRHAIGSTGGPTVTQFADF